MTIDIYNKAGMKFWRCPIKTEYNQNGKPRGYSYYGYFEDGKIEEYDDIEKLMLDEEPIFKIIRIINCTTNLSTRFIRNNENNYPVIYDFFDYSGWTATEISSFDKWEDGPIPSHPSVEFEITDPKGRKRDGDEIFKQENIKTYSLFDKILKTQKLLEQLSLYGSFRDYDKKNIISTTHEMSFTEKSMPFSALNKLNSLIGLNSVKEEINSLIQFVKVRKIKLERKLMVTPSTLHMVFTGNPGTGKTTVARIIGELYKELGLISKGHCVEVSRTDLVGKYVGHTAPLVTEKFNEAIGGILFIDEAYQLIEGGENDFGKEAISTLLKLMEDNREKLVVIVAGYPVDMKKFIESNPGLDSRFATKIHFEDFSGEELFDCLTQNCNEKNYSLTLGAQEKARQYLEKCAIPRPESFANGRGIRNLFEKIERNQSTRLARIEQHTDEELLEFTDSDIPDKCA